MRWAKKARTGRSSAKSVLTWLADMCSADLTTYPSIAALAEATELDKKTVQASLRYLMDMGFIQDTGERRGRTKQIPVYRLVGVEESIADAEQTQKREHYQKRNRSKDPKNGTVNDKEPEIGTVKTGQTIPFFPSNDPKNGIRNPPEESKDLNPTYNTRESEVGPVNQSPAPEYPGQPGIAYPAAPPLGKFPMNPKWVPSADFRQRAAYWNFPIPADLVAKDLKAALASFTDYWISEQKVFTQTQWEQKFARHLQNAKPSQSRGNNHAGPDKYPPTYNAAQRRALDARRAQLRERGQSVDVLDLDDGNLFQPVDGQKRLSPIGPMDCSDWEFDQRPDDERL
jgi:pyocin large subunit-like protein